MDCYLLLAGLLAPGFATSSIPADCINICMLRRVDTRYSYLLQMACRQQSNVQDEQHADTNAALVSCCSKQCSSSWTQGHTV